MGLKKKRGRGQAGGSSEPLEPLWIRHCGSSTMKQAYLATENIESLQVKNIFLVNFSHIYANNFCDAGHVPILRYFEA